MKAKFFYTGIRVKDLEASVKFYTALLGMKVRSRNTVDAAKGTVVELVCEGEGGNTLELNYYEKGSSFDTKYEVGEGLDHLAFAIRDLDAALAEAAKAGHPVVQKMQEPGSRYAYIQDPNGIWIELAQFGRARNGLRCLPCRDGLAGNKAYDNVILTAGGLRRPPGPRQVHAGPITRPG